MPLKVHDYKKAEPRALRRADTGTGVLVYGSFHPARLRLRPLSIGPTSTAAWLRVSSGPTG
jgi:hypothetical protein